MTLSDPGDCSLSGSSVYGIIQQEYSSGLPFTSPGHPPEPGIKVESPTWEAPDVLIFAQLVLNIPF